MFVSILVSSLTWFLSISTSATVHSLMLCARCWHLSSIWKCTLVCEEFSRKMFQRSVEKVSHVPSRLFLMCYCGLFFVSLLLLIRFDFTYLYCDLTDLCLFPSFVFLPGWFLICLDQQLGKQLSKSCSVCLLRIIALYKKILDFDWTFPLDNNSWQQSHSTEVCI